MSKPIGHNVKVRLLLFFARPLHVFNIYLFAIMWKYMSYGPTTFQSFFGKHTAVQVTTSLWSEVFSPLILWFILAAIADMLYQEFLPTIKR